MADKLKVYFLSPEVVPFANPAGWPMLLVLCRLH
jgi:hypothetical protein